MKRLLLMAFLLPVVAVSCKKDDVGTDNDGKGSIALESKTDKGVIPIITRAGEENDYFLTVEGPGGLIKDKEVLGDTREIPDLDPGDYTVTLVSELNVSMPAWNHPIYGASVTQPVTSGSATKFTLTCTQTNVGIRFVFDSSVTGYYQNPVATIEGADGSESYTPANQTANGIVYFNPGTLKITLNDDNGSIPIGGEASQNINTNAQELWTITLKTATKTSGAIEMDVSVDKMVTPKAPEFGVGDVTGDGTAGSPFSVASAINAMPRNGVWVEGYITGTATITPVTKSGAVETILIGLSASSPAAECIVVELPEGSTFRTELGIDVEGNTSFIGKRIAVRGNVVGKSDSYTSDAFATVTGVYNMNQNYFTDLNKSVNYYYNTQVLKTNPAGVKIGAAVTTEQLTGYDAEPTYRQIVKRDFNSLTSVYNMKMGTILKTQGQYDYSGADEIVAFAKANGMRMHGHVLVWSLLDELPGWVRNQNLTTDGWKQFMQTYIRTVMEHFGDDVASWDVVNEAINEDGTIMGSGGWEEAGSKFWYEKLGADFIEIAFQAAYDAREDLGLNCKLFYNDYNFINDAKRAGIKAVIEPLIEKGLVDGIGMQMHYDVRAKIVEINAAMADVATWGSSAEKKVLVHVSEVDMLVNNPDFIADMKGNNWITGEYITLQDMVNFNVDYAQGKSYNIVAYAYMQHVPADQRFGITTWGVTDEIGYRNGTETHYDHVDFQYLFGVAYNPKRAYDGFLEGLNGIDWNEKDAGGGRWNWRFEDGFEPTAP